jgi:hypothetical protein
MTTTLSAVNVRRRLATAALLLAVPTLTSCTVNFDEQTDKVYNPSVGVDDRSGEVEVLNALIVSGGTGSGTVVATLVNEDQTTADQLKSVAGEGADAALKVTPGGATTVPAAGLLNLAAQGRIFARGPEVVPGNFVSITFTFQRAKAITVDVPVVDNSGTTYSGVPLPPG